MQVEKTVHNPPTPPSEQGRSIRIDQFEGPLEMLLRLIEDQELDITQVSLSKVADQYLALLHTEKHWDPDALADFLVIAARLVYIKSKTLLPTLLLDDEEAGARDLERQLKMLKLYLDASKDVHAITSSGAVTYARTKLPKRPRGDEFVPPKNLSGPLLESAFRGILEAVKPYLPHPRKIEHAVVSLEERIAHIHRAITEKISTSFRSITGSDAAKIDIIVSFLALLELVKRRTVRVEQGILFDDIAIHRHAE